MQKVLFGFVCIFIVSLLSGCSSSNMDPESWDPIIFGVSPDYPPLVQMANEGEYAGYEVDLAKRVAYKLKRKPVFEEMPAVELQGALLNENVDVIIGGIIKHHSRGSTISYTDAVLHAGQMAIIRRNDIDKYPTVSSLKDKAKLRVGVVTSSVADSIVNLVFDTPQVVRFTSVEDAYLRLKMEDLDVFIHDAQTAWTNADPALTAILKPLSYESYAWGVRPNETILLEDINDAFIILRYRGEVDQLKTKWIGGDKSPVIRGVNP